MSYAILGQSCGRTVRYSLIWSAGMDADGHRFIGDFRSYYEAQFEKRLLQDGQTTEEEVKERAKADYRKWLMGRKPKRDRFLRLRLNQVPLAD